MRKGGEKGEVGGIVPWLFGVIDAGESGRNYFIQCLCAVDLVMERHLFCKTIGCRDPQLNLL